MDCSHQLLGRGDGLRYLLPGPWIIIFHLGHKVCSQPCPNYYIFCLFFFFFFFFFLPFSLVPIDVLPLRVTPPLALQTSLSYIFSRTTLQHSFHSPVLFPSSWIIPSSHQFAVIFHLWKKCIFWFPILLKPHLILPCPLDQSFSIEAFTLAVTILPLV